MTDTTSPRNPSEFPTSPPSAAETPRTAPRSDAQGVPAPEVTPDAERASAGRVALIRAALDSAPDALITLDADDVREMLDTLSELRTYIQVSGERAAEARALRARLDAVLAAACEWIDTRGVDAGDRDDDYMDGYRAAQRHALLDAADLRAILVRAAEGVES